MTKRQNIFRCMQVGMLVTFALLVGCGSQEEIDTYDQYFEELLARIQRLTEELESIDSATTALQEADKVKQLSTQLQQKLGESSSLPSANSIAGLKIKQRYEELWEPRFQEAFERLDAAAESVIRKTKQDRVPKRVGIQLKRLQSQIESFRRGLRTALREQGDADSEN